MVDEANEVTADERVTHLVHRLQVSPKTQRITGGTLRNHAQKDPSPSVVLDDRLSDPAGFYAQEPEQYGLRWRASKIRATKWDGEQFDVHADSTTAEGRFADEQAAHGLLTGPLTTDGAAALLVSVAEQLPPGGLA